MEVHWLQLNTSLLEKLVSAERLISLAKAGRSWSVKSYMRCIQKKEGTLFCPLQVKTIGRAYQMEVEKLHVLKVIPDAIQGNGLHVQDNSRWQCPTWLWYFLWRLLALGPHRMWLHRGLSWLLHVFSLWAGTEVGSCTFKKRSRDKLLSEQGSSISLGFLWTWRHSAPLRFGLWPLAVSSLHPQVNPTSKTMGCRWKSAGKQPHSHTRSSVTTQYSSCWHYSLFSYCFSERKIRSTSFFPG